MCCPDRRSHARGTGAPRRGDATHQGAQLLGFLQAMRRLQDGDTEAPVTVPATPERPSVPVSLQTFHLYVNLIQGDARPP